jgi:hypothetical protein
MAAGDGDARHAQSRERRGDDVSSAGPPGDDARRLARGRSVLSKFQGTIDLERRIGTDRGTACFPMKYECLRFKTT